MARTAKILKRFPFMVRGIKWNAYIYSPSEFDKLDGADGADALSDEETRTIYLKTSQLTLIAVRHEVVHAYAASFHLASASLTGKQMEEVFAEWLSRRVEEYVSTCERLWRKIDAWKNNRRAKAKHRKAAKKIEKAVHGIGDPGAEKALPETRPSRSLVESAVLPNPVHKKETS